MARFKINFSKSYSFGFKKVKHKFQETYFNNYMTQKLLVSPKEGSFQKNGIIFSIEHDSCYGVVLNIELGMV